MVCRWRLLKNLTGTRLITSQTPAVSMVSPREIRYVIADDRLYCVAFVDRPADAPTERRIISLRTANRRRGKAK